MRVSPLVPVALAAAMTLSLLAPPRAAAVDPGSVLIPCSQADQRVDITVSSHLDPSCTWTRGVEILASNVTLDCQGAHIAAPDRRYGVHIVSTVAVPLSNITVRNCHVEGFLNNYHIEREDFRTLPEGVEYENGFSNIVIEDSTSLNSRGVGIFVNGYVEGVTLRRLHVEGASSTGIYLEAGSKNNVVEDNDIINNGYGENGPTGGFFDFAGASFWFWGIGREGLAIDGSRFNIVRNNYFTGNSAGGIFLYTNCGEFYISRPERWFQRRFGADGNTIENNTFDGEDNGIWVGSRMSENILPMQCSNPQYLPGYSLDFADDNVIRDNVFENVPYGIRVEDDGTVIEDNEFTSTNAAHSAVIIGTEQRTEALGEPVDGTVVTGNEAFIAGNTHPYRWIHGHTNTTFTGNESQGEIVGMCEGVQPPRGPFVFVVDFVPAEPPTPPPGPPATFPPPQPLPSCGLACESGGSVLKPRIVVRKLNTPAGDDTLSFEGRLVVPHPFDPTLNPVANGIGVVVADATGARALDVQIPGGAYDPVAKVGWKASKRGTSWTYTNKSATPPSGITSVTIKDQSKKAPGQLQISVKGKNGDYPVGMTSLPLTGLFVLDQPTAETGQCAQASFVLPQRCTTDGKGVTCR